MKALDPKMIRRIRQIHYLAALLCKHYPPMSFRAALREVTIWAIWKSCGEFAPPRYESWFLAVHLIDEDLHEAHLREAGLSPAEVADMPW